MTFDQEVAAENPKAAHLSVVHPLVRQAARFLEITEPKFFSLAAESDELPPGAHAFALYRWVKHGVRPDEALIPVTDDPKLEDALLSLLSAAAGPDSGPTARPCRLRFARRAAP